jgi:D-sedoheptulose 7-phosphate isomerase
MPESRFVGYQHLETSDSVNEPSFLYPFLGSSGSSNSSKSTSTSTSTTQSVTESSLADAALAELAAAARSSWNSGDALDEATIIENDQFLDEAARLIVDCAKRSKRVFVVGNGGSACDAERLVRLLKPSIEARPLLDSVVITALANDVGAERIFDRQIETFVKRSDVVVAFSTSGTSTNILNALSRARRQGAHTIVFAGYEGADLPSNPNVNVCLSVKSSSVHRIQEAQGALSFALVERVATQLLTNAGVSDGKVKE